MSRSEPVLTLTCLVALRTWVCGLAPAGTDTAVVWRKAGAPHPHRPARTSEGEAPESSAGPNLLVAGLQPQAWWQWALQAMGVVRGVQEESCAELGGAGRRSHKRWLESEGLQA